MTTGLRMCDPKINQKIAAGSWPVYFCELLINPVIIAFFDLWTMLMINKWQQHRHMKKLSPKNKTLRASTECWQCFCCQFPCWQQPESWTMAEVGRGDREKRPCPDPWQTREWELGETGPDVWRTDQRRLWHNYICISNWCNYNVFTLQPSGSQNTEIYGLFYPVWLLNEIIPRIHFNLLLFKSRWNYRADYKEKKTLWSYILCVQRAICLLDIVFRNK